MTSASPPARRRCWAVMVLAGTVLLVAACAGESGDGALGGEVAPFADIQASELSFEADPGNPERGIFRVETTEPAICAIVWGETEALGNFNNSLSMNGTGIVDHDVVLPGLESGREYFYIVQGTTADGTWYRSELATFTIDSPDAVTSATRPITGDNLAESGTVVDVSSEFGPDWAATNAIDGSGLTEWSTAGDGDDAFITVDLGADQPIDTVEFITRSMLDGTAITETYTVTIDDQRFGPFPAGTPADPMPSTVTTEGRVVRFDVETSSGGNVGAVEVRILAPIAPVAED
jgi:hypothetical protein